MKARKLLDKEEFDYDHFTRLTSTGIEPDYNTIAQFAEKYHQEQLKLLNIDFVSKAKAELLIAFSKWKEEKGYTPIYDHKGLVKEYLSNL
mgnify:CR=1 FL=1|tara:strand:+ start:523 stop:792 length:270 start_codon:yes stop_codon:yes gene_type:complete